MYSGCDEGKDASPQMRLKRAATAAVLALSTAPCTHLIAANTVADVVSKSISELSPTATIHVGKTADWVAIVPDAVWVGSTGPFAVHRIDPKTNQLVATIGLPGEPCAGLASGFGSLWVPLCGDYPAMAKVDLSSNKLVSVIKLAGVAAEGGVTASADSVWVVVDEAGSLARIAPDTGVVRQIVRVPAGSFNPLYNEGHIWITRVAGAEVTVIDALEGTLLATVPTGPNPRFLTASGDAVWTLNQGDGSLTRIDARNHSTKTIGLGTPGHGGDISFGGGMIWTTMAKVPLSAIDASAVSLRCHWTGPGGDSLGVGHGAIWLTDYHAGTISRIGLEETLARCRK
jgi:virginiamycin B lyase